ncbi:hypothetical protein B0O99DRAFT_62311 [Bisporella sp. PMI_857]|nr:hypothetical protein B0O99DRAFT_62311 [Bisporella sp. PMI_857]
MRGGVCPGERRTKRGITGKMPQGAQSHCWGVATLGGCSALQILGLGKCLADIDAVKVVGYEVIHYGKGAISHTRRMKRARDLKAEVFTMADLSLSSAKLVLANQISQLSRLKLST